MSFGFVGFTISDTLWFPTWTQFCFKKASNILSKIAFSKQQIHMTTSFRLIPMSVKDHVQVTPCTAGVVSHFGPGEPCGTHTLEMSKQYADTVLIWASWFAPRCPSSRGRILTWNSSRWPRPVLCRARTVCFLYPSDKHWGRIPMSRSQSELSDPSVCSK